MKLKNILLTAFVLFGIAISVQAQSPGQLANWKSFLNGSYVVLPWAPSGTTTNITVADTNAFYVKSWYQTNSATYPYVSGWGPLYTIGVPFADVVLWADRDGTPPNANFTAVITDSSTNGAINTNAITFRLTLGATFADPQIQGVPTYVDNAAVDSWSFTTVPAAGQTNAQGNTLIAISTNIPTGFLQGAQFVRLDVTVYPQGTNNGPGWTNYSGTYYATNSSYSQTNVNNGWLLIKAGINGFPPTLSM